jgi:hypothetical protein
MTQFLFKGMSGAILSPCRCFRYLLWRRVGDAEKTLAFICLNPSIADESDNDPTVRRCMGFAQREGAGVLCMLNLFSFRSTDPKNCEAHYHFRDREAMAADDNWKWLMVIPCLVDVTIAAWGAHEMARQDSYGLRVRAGLRDRGVTLYHLGLTKGRQPRHPLYLKADTPLQRWR